MLQKLVKRCITDPPCIYGCFPSL